LKKRLTWLVLCLLAAPMFVVAQHHTATDSQENPKWGYPGYGQMAHGVWVEFQSAQQFDVAMQGRGVNGSSQDYDCTPRSLWSEGGTER
jgi:hypothetical protein